MRLKNTTIAGILVISSATYANPANGVARGFGTHYGRALMKRHFWCNGGMTIQI